MTKESFIDTVKAVSPNPADAVTYNKWKILLLLFLANMLNFFDRTIPAIIIEPLRFEFNLSDLQLGFVAASFTLVYAIAGLPFGRLADKGSRKKIIGWGLMAWSGFTALNAAAWNFVSFFLVRMGVGVGEASYAPAANSLIGDLFPAEKRARAMGIFMLGLPLGLILAFFTVGAIAEAFDSWRAPFIVAAIPGFILALFFFKMKEPPRGASEGENYTAKTVQNPIRTLLKIKTLRWIILSGLSVNFAVYAGNSFFVPLFQRYFGLSLTQSAVITGCIVGITGLIGLTLGGVIADKIHQRFARGRLVFGAICLFISAIFIGIALYLGNDSLTAVVILLSLGWLASYNYYTTVYPAIQDVVEPNLRATAMAVYFACMYILGGAFGPIVVGALSDHFSQAAMLASGSAVMTEHFKAVGLHNALFVIPVALFFTAVFVYLSSRSFVQDTRRLQ